MNDFNKQNGSLLNIIIFLGKILFTLYDQHGVRSVKNGHS